MTNARNPGPKSSWPRSQGLRGNHQIFHRLPWVEESGRDDSYPRTAVSDGSIRLTLWEVDKSLAIQQFHRRQNVGLHHLAITVPTEAALYALNERVAKWNGVEIEFAPELVGKGPRKHMMFNEPSGIRMEFIWSGE